MRQSLIDGEENFAQRIAMERARRGWSLAELARRLGEEGMPTDHTTVWKIEHGRRTIRLDQFVAFCRVFGLSPGDLLTPVALVGIDRAERLAKEVNQAQYDYLQAGENMALALAKLRQFEAANPVAGRHLLDLLAERLRRGPSVMADASSWKLIGDECTLDAISAMWDATYGDDSAGHYGMFMRRAGYGVVPIPDEPKWSGPSAYDEWKANN